MPEEEKISFQGEKPEEKPAEPAEAPEASSKQKNTGMAIVAYILFFIPLFTDAKKDPFVKYHVKQGLLIFLGWIAIAILSWIVGWYFYTLWILIRLLNLVVFVLMVIGIINASQGKQVPLPIVGKFAEKFKF